MNSPDKRKFSSLTDSNHSKRKTAQDILIKYDDIHILESISFRKNGLGTINRATFQNSEIIVRVLKFDRLSRYDLEGIQKDIEILA